MERKERNGKTDHLRKMIAAGSIGLLAGGYYIAIGAAIICITDLPAVVKLILAGILAALTGVLVFVLIERIREIRSGEEDDLGKY